MIGKIQFGLQAGGQRLGTIKAENWRAWNFRIEDHTGAEVARITKTLEGLAKTMFTTADNYVVQIHTARWPALHALVVASAPLRRHGTQAGRSRLRLSGTVGHRSADPAISRSTSLLRRSANSWRSARHAASFMSFNAS